MFCDELSLCLLSSTNAGLYINLKLLLVYYMCEPHSRWRTDFFSLSLLLSEITQYICVI